MTAKVRLSVKAIKVWDSWKNFVSEMRLKSSVVIGSDDVIGESIHANSIFESSSASLQLDGGIKRALRVLKTMD